VGEKYCKNEIKIRFNEGTDFVVNKTSVFPKIKHTQAFPLEIYLSSFDLYISSEIHIEEFNTKLILCFGCLINHFLSKHTSSMDSFLQG